MISFKNYGNYSSDNYGKHSLVFTDPKRNRFWFSYNTLVAFCSDKGFFIRHNDWSTTTGKHLNWISKDKKERLTKEQFRAKYKESFGKDLGNSLND